METPCSCLSALFFLSEQEDVPVQTKHSINHIQSYFLIIISLLLSITHHLFRINKVYSQIIRIIFCIQHIIYKKNNTTIRDTPTCKIIISMFCQLYFIYFFISSSNNIKYKSRSLINFSIPISASNSTLSICKRAYILY